MIETRAKKETIRERKRPREEHAADELQSVVDPR
jgi:hypothetical protein